MWEGPTRNSRETLLAFCLGFITGANLGILTFIILSR